MLNWLFSTCRLRVSSAKIAAAFKTLEGSDLEIFQETLKNVDVNSRNQYGFTLLHQTILKTNHANEKIRFVMAHYLLMNGANPDLTPSNHAFTPLLSAVRRNLPSMIILLLQYNANPELKNKKNKNARDYAIELSIRKGDDRALLLLNERVCSESFHPDNKSLSLSRQIHA